MIKTTPTFPSSQSQVCFCPKVCPLLKRSDECMYQQHEAGTWCFEETSRWNFRRGMLFHFSLMQDSSCSALLSFTRSVVLWCTKCFGFVKALDCRQASSTDLYTLQPFSCKKKSKQPTQKTTINVVVGLQPYYLRHYLDGTIGCF